MGCTEKGCVLWELYQHGSRLPWSWVHSCCTERADTPPHQLRAQVPVTQPHLQLPGHELLCCTALCWYPMPWASLALQAVPHRSARPCGHSGVEARTCGCCCSQSTLWNGSQVRAWDCKLATSWTVVT